MQPYKPTLKPLARNLRGNMTDAEQRLWSKLRRKQILGVQFYRQKPLANYIVDFYCAAANLVIELDGSQHLSRITRPVMRKEIGCLNHWGSWCCALITARSCKNWMQ